MVQLLKQVPMKYIQPVYCKYSIIIKIPSCSLSSVHNSRLVQCVTLPPSLPPSLSLRASVLVSPDRSRQSPVETWLYAELQESSLWWKHTAHPGRDDTHSPGHLLSDFLQEHNLPCPPHFITLRWYLSLSPECSVCWVVGWLWDNSSVSSQASQESQESQRSRESLQRRCFTCRSRGERGDCRDPFQLPEEQEGAERRESVNRAVSQVGRKYLHFIKKIFLSLKIFQIPCSTGWCSKVT